MSEETLKIIALVLFGLLYVGVIGFPKYKMWVALAVAAAYIVLGIVRCRAQLEKAGRPCFRKIRGIFPAQGRKPAD